MSVAPEIERPAAKKRVIYALMIVTGTLFVSTLTLPIGESTASFGSDVPISTPSGRVSPEEE